MILTRNELYVINHLNGNKNSIFGVDIPEDYSIAIDQGYGELKAKKLIGLDFVDEKITEKSLVLEKYNKFNHYISVGSLNMAFSKSEMEVVVLLDLMDGNYNLYLSAKGLIMMQILNQIPFLQKKNNVKSSKEVDLNYQEILEELADVESCILRYFEFSKLSYSSMLIDFYDYILEFDYTVNKARAVPAQHIREKLVKWTNLGGEYGSNRNRL